MLKEHDADQDYSTQENQETPVVKDCGRSNARTLAVGRFRIHPAESAPWCDRQQRPR